MDRRSFIKNSAMIAAASVCANSLASSKVSPSILENVIPSSWQKLPVIGMGTYRNLSVQLTSENIASRTQLLQKFFDLGGQMLDSSPMYGTSEQMIGRCLKALHYPKTLFSTTKVWTRGKKAGIEQMKQSLSYWGLDKFELMQVHNLLDWQTQLQTLRDWQEQGIIKYIGITTSHGRDHQQLAQILKTQPLDFVQLTYNIKDRTVENRLLPLAAEKGVAVIVNRPFSGLFGYTKGVELPKLAKEIGCRSWAQFYLKFAVSHPAVTCAIPATSKMKHLEENMLAGYGNLPDAKTRQEMIRLFSPYL